MPSPPTEKSALKPPVKCDDDCYFTGFGPRVGLGGRRIELDDTAVVYAEMRWPAACSDDEPDTDIGGKPKS